MEEMTINNEQLRRENNVLKTDITQLKKNDGAMKDEVKQLKVNNDKQRDEIGQLKVENQQLKVSWWSGITSALNIHYHNNPHINHTMFIGL